MSKKRWACWKCGAPMKKRGLACRKCETTKPQAVKTLIAALTKAQGRPLPPVRVSAPAKAPRPKCPKCGVKGKRTANTCARCGAPFTLRHAIAADKAISSRLALVRSTPEWFEAQAAAAYDPAERESWRAEAQKAREARGETTLHTASLLVKASGGRSLREAYLRETDPLAQQILRDVLDGRR